MKTLAITPVTKENERIHMLECCQISANKRQPRQYFDDIGIWALADSIHRHGIIQPISVRRTENGYELVAGERRLRAARLLKMERVPCMIMDTDERTSAVMAVIENIQRQELNIFEEAMAILTLKDIYNMTQENIARTLSVSQSYVANKLRLLRFNGEEQRLILDHRLTERHCRALLRVADEQRAEALNHIIRYNLNVAAAEGYIDKLLAEQKPKPKIVNRQLKDLRLFYNSINRAVTTVKKLGVNVTTETTEDEDCKRMTIIIRN